MLLNLNKNKWSEGLRLEAFDKHADANEKVRRDTPPFNLRTGRIGPLP